MSNLPLAELAALARHRWTVPVVAAIAARRGARFAELLHLLPVSRESLTRGLAQAVAGGWIMRNPGHGHPLRPEYVLTGKGKAVADAVRALAEAQAKSGIAPGALGRWSLPVLHLLSQGQDRFNALSRALGEASPRALTLTLKALTAGGLVRRDVIPGWPPATRYALTERGAALAGTG